MKNYIYTAIKILLFISIIALGIWHHFNVIFNPDNYWLLFITNKLLHGGRYFKDFIEVNPPMILYLNILPVVLSTIFQLEMTTVFIFYMSVLAAISILTCHWLFRKSSDNDSKTIRYAVVATLIYVFFFFFSIIFGEREFLTLVFILPYLLLANIRIQKQQINLVAIILIGLFAGIGFAIKPYFLIPLIFVEIYLMFQKQTFWAWCRPETLIIGLVLITYLISIFVVTPEYIYQVIPFAHQFYYMGYTFSWSLLYKNLPYVFMIAVPPCYILVRRQLFYKHLIDILLVAGFGFLLVYYLARQSWIYHFYPVYALLCMAIVLIIIDLFIVTIHSKNITSRRFYQNIGLILFMGALFLLSPVANSQMTGKGYLLSRYRANYKNIGMAFDSYSGDKSMAVFSTLYDVMVLMKYGHLYSMIRYPNPPYLLAGYYIKRASLPNNQAKIQFDKKEKTVINMIADDLTKYPPAFIFFGVSDVPDDASYSQSLTYPAIIKTLSSNQQFKQLWKQYRFYRYLQIVRERDPNERLVVFKRG